MGSQSRIDSLFGSTIGHSYKNPNKQHYPMAEEPTSSCAKYYFRDINTGRCYTAYSTDMTRKKSQESLNLGNTILCAEDRHAWVTPPATKSLFSQNMEKQSK